MPLTRREFLKLAGLVAASATLSACQPVYAEIGGAVETGPVSAGTLTGGEFTALSRLTFGPRASERQHLSEIGLPAWIEEQLAPKNIDDAPLEWRLRGFDILDLDPATLADLGDLLFDGIQPENVLAPFRQATLLRQVYSRRQLYEIMVEFWTDHFNIAVSKGDCWYLKVVDDREVIRPHTLGNFRELLLASAHSPAMLVYLDNQANEAAAPNENYAREVMELHTLGVDGGYTQHDVMELARCLTGWTVNTGLRRGRFAFEPDFHDRGRKTVLGKPIPPGGEEEAVAVLERLATHPSTALHIATKLARRFIADDPPPEVVARTADTFLKSGGDIPASLRTLLLDGLVPRQNRLPLKFKRPVNFLVSALRTFNAETDGGAPLQKALTRMGQGHYEWPTPDGPPDTSGEWQGNLLPRWQFSLALARNEINGTQLDVEQLIRTSEATDIESFLERVSPWVLGTPLPSRTRDLIASRLRSAGATDTPETAPVILAGLVASPMFQWR